MMQVRALRRHHYFKRLRNQQRKMVELRKTIKNTPNFETKLSMELLALKKVRLVEDRIPYQELAVLDNFSEDEMTCT